LRNNTVTTSAYLPMGVPLRHRHSLPSLLGERSEETGYPLSFIEHTEKGICLTGKRRFWFPKEDCTQNTWNTYARERNFTKRSLVLICCTIYVWTYNSTVRLRSCFIRSMEVKTSLLAVYHDNNLMSTSGHSHDCSWIPCKISLMFLFMVFRSIIF